jgi:aspartate/methionine/tyrosine aminotransferase
MWIIADEAYERLYYGGEANACAPSFLDVADSHARLVVTNTFSKSWLMTGWRLGWLVAPSELITDVAKLIEYNTSCAPGFVQRAGIIAVRDGESTITQFGLRQAPLTA